MSCMGGSPPVWLQPRCKVESLHVRGYVWLGRCRKCGFSLFPCHLRISARRHARETLSICWLFSTFSERVKFLEHFAFRTNKNVRWRWNYNSSAFQRYPGFDNRFNSLGERVHQSWIVVCVSHEGAFPYKYKWTLRKQFKCPFMRNASNDPTLMNSFSKAIEPIIESRVALESWVVVVSPPPNVFVCSEREVFQKLHSFWKSWK